MKTGILEVKVTLRPKGQLTLPQRIVRKLNAKPGDDLIISMQDDQPERLQIRRLRRSYAGVATGVYGTPQEVSEYIERERDAWDK